jgi:hypothetical protein
MRKALIVGIDDYPGGALNGCVRDAERIRALLEHHHDGRLNFDCRILTSKSSVVTRAEFLQAIDALLAGTPEAALMYFAGHGVMTDTGGHLLTQDTKKYAEGVEMASIVVKVSNSKATEVAIMLDCCHSGGFGQHPSYGQDGVSLLRHGMSILAAAAADENAEESDRQGVFTSLVCDALEGGAADVCGRTTAASVYAYVDQALGPWSQRPIFKANVSRLISLRDVEPAVALGILRSLPQIFSSPEAELSLDPSYEPDLEPHDETHERLFGDLQKLRAARLLVPIGEEHLYFAALRSRACRLTALGRYYWRLASEHRL